MLLLFVESNPKGANVTEFTQFLKNNGIPNLRLSNPWESAMWNYPLQVVTQRHPDLILDKVCALPAFNGAHVSYINLTPD